MFHHIVLYKVKEPKQEVVQEMKRRFLEMPLVIDEIKSINVGINEITSDRSCDISLYIKLENKEMLNFYLENPFHKSVAEYIAQVKESSYSVDYED